jgi:hypothetical protein
MSRISLRLVHDRPFVTQTDDLAVVLLFSMAGLFMHLVTAFMTGTAG